MVPFYKNNNKNIYFWKTVELQKIKGADMW
jgi:hypothetical protein